MLIRRAASSAFAVVLRVTQATCPWTLQASGLLVYCTSTRKTMQKYKSAFRLSLPLPLLLLAFFFWALVLPVCAGHVRLSAILFDALHPLLSVQCLESPVGKRKRSLAVSSSQDPSFSGLNQVWNHNHLLVIAQKSLLFLFCLFEVHFPI